jgi:hypothetical protein
MWQLLGPPVFLPPQGHWGPGQGLTPGPGHPGSGGKKSERQLGQLQGPGCVYSEPY